MNAKEAREKAGASTAGRANQLITQIDGYIEREVAAGAMRVTVDITAFGRHEVDAALGILVKRGFKAKEESDYRNGTYLDISWK